MTNFQAVRLFMALSATLFLSGCFVTSRQIPAGQGPINDDAIVGDWRGVDADNGKEESVFVHIQKPDAAKPLRVVFVEEKDYNIYELTTTQTGAHKVFSAKVLGPEKAVQESKGGSFLGYYEVKGNEARFWLLDANKVTTLIKAGKVKGNPGKSKYDFAELTGNPAELASFLASDDGWNARADDPAILRRITTLH
ncbi:MAG: hypothetical protein ABL973_13680 [Micropepsaceae bacterium]